MSTNYGRLAYQKVEDLSKKIKHEDIVNRIMVYAYKNVALEFDVSMFSHKLLAHEGEVINCKIEYNVSTEIDLNVKIVINGVPVHHDISKIFTFDFISSGDDSIELYFTGEGSITISSIKLTYTGRLKNNLDENTIYFDENQGAFVHFNNGALTKYTTIDSFISAYSYTTNSKDFLCVNSVITALRKNGFYAIYYDDTTGYIVLRNLANTTTYNLVAVEKPDSALFMPVSSSLYRVVFVKNGKVYYFNTSKYGTNISAITEAPLDNFKVKSVFPIVVVHNNTTNIKMIGVIGEDGVAYILRFDDDSANFVGRKYIGKCDYATGFYDNNSINIVLYNNGVARVLTYADRLVTNLVEEKKYYNCYRIFKLSSGILGLNFEGVSILT